MPMTIHLKHHMYELFAVQCYKRTHYGFLPANTRRTYYKAAEEGCGFITTQSTLQADHEHMVPPVLRDDFDVNPHLGPDEASMDD